MSWLFPRVREWTKVRTKRNRQTSREFVPVMESLESRLAPATALFNSGTGELSLLLAGSENALIGDANASGAQLLIQMGPGQTLDVTGLPVAMVASSTSSSAILNLDLASPDDVTGLKVNYAATSSNIVTFSDLKPANLLNVALNDNAASGTNTLTIGGAVDLSLKNSSFVTTSTADPTYAQRLTFQLYGKIDAGTGDIRLASKLTGTGVSNLEVNSPDSPDLKGTNITIDVAGSIGFDKTGTPQPLELQASGLISIQNTDNPAQLKSVGGTNNFGLLDLKTGTATLFGDFKTNGAEVIGNQTTINLDSTGILSLGGDETIRTLIGSGTMNLGNSNGFKLTLDTIETKTFAGVITGGSTGLLTIQGTGTQELSGTSTYTGGTEVKIGATLLLTNSSGAGTGDITVRDGATLNLKGGIAPANKVIITGKGVGSTTLGALQNLSGNNSLTGTLVVSGDSLVNVPAGKLTLGAVTLSGNLTTYAEAGTSILFNGAIDDSTNTFGLKTTGKGAVTLAVKNTYDGGTNITEGTTTILHEEALGTAAAQVQDGASLILSGASLAVANALSISGTGFGGIGVIQNLAGTNTLKGDIQVNSASLITVPAGSLTLSGKVNLGGDLTLNTSAGTAITVSGVIDDGAGTFGLNATGAGTVTLTNANLYNGATVVGAGTTLVLAEAGGNKGSISSTGVTLTDAASHFVFNRTDAEATPFVFSPIISGPGKVTVSTGAVQYNTTQAYTGVTTLNANTVLQVGDTTTNGWIDAKSNIVDNGKLIFQRNDTKTIPNFISGSGNVIFRSTGTFTLATDNTYSGGTTVEPGTTLILASANAAGTGAITVMDTADLRLDGSSKGGITVPNAISVTGQGRDNKGALRNVAGTNTFQGGITLNSSIFIGTIPGDANTLTISGVINDADKFYGITLFGQGKLIVTAANLYDGNTNLFEGDLVLRNALGAGKTGTILIQSGSTLYLDPLGGGSMTLSNTINLAGLGRGGVGAIVNLTGANTIDGDVFMNASSSISALPGTTLTLLSTLDDDTSTFDLTLQGGGTIVLGAESLYDGVTTIKDSTTGILTAKNAAGEGPMVIENGSTLGLKGGITVINNITVGGTGVSGAGAIQNLAGDNTLLGTGKLSADTLISVAAGTNLSWTGVIDDGVSAFGVSVIGGGNLNLTANNTFNGKTTIGALTTVTLGAGGTTGNLSSTQVDNSGKLVFNRIDTTASPMVFTPFITGTGAVLVSTGAVQFTGNHTYTGGTTINPGATLIIGDAGSNGSVLGDILDNGALWYRRSGPNPVLINAKITGTGTVTFKDTATYQLMKANNWSGVTTIETNATVNVGDGTGTSVGAISTGFVAAAVGSIVVDGHLVFNAGGPNRFVNQTLSGAGKVTYQAAGLYVVSGTNTYSGVTTIDNAELMLTTANGVSTNTVKILALGTLGLDSATGIKLANAIEVTGSGQLVAGAIRSKSGANELSGTVQLKGNTTLSNLTSDTGSLLFSNVISGAFGLTIAGPQKGVRLTAANTYTGLTTINAGAKLILGDGVNNTGSILSSGVVLNTNGTNGDGQLQFNRQDTKLTPFNFPVPISGQGAVDILTGAVRFTGNNTFTGTTTIFLGATLIIGDGSSNGTITSNIVDNGLLIFDVTLAPPTLPGLIIPGTISGTGDVEFRQTGPYTLTADSAYTGNTTINPGATVQLGNGGTTGSIPGNILNNGSLIFNRSANLTVAQTISSTGVAGSVTFKGGAQYTVSGNNSWDLGTTVTGGSTLIMASSTAAGTGAITIDTGAALALKGAASLTVANAISVAGNGPASAGAIQNAANSNTLSGPITLTGNTLIALSGGNTLTTTGVISGAFGVTTTGSGKWQTSVNNTFTGDTTIGSGTTLHLGDGTGTTGSVASANIIDNGALVFNRTDAVGSPFIVSALISGTGTVTVSSGAVQFNGNNTYTGDTTINPTATLIVGNGATSGGIYQPAFAGKIVNNNALIFQRSDGTFASPLTNNASISGSGSVTYRSGGVFQAGSASTYSGGTKIEANTGLILANGTSAGTGDIQVSNTQATLALKGGVTVANNIVGGGSGVGGTNGFLQSMTGTNILTGSVTLNAGAGINILSGSILRVTGTITDGASSFGIFTMGPGRLELPNTNTYDGGTQIFSGTVMLGKSGSAGTGGILISAGTTLELNSGTTITLANALQSAGTISAIGGNHTLSGPIVLTGTTVFQNNGTNLTQTGIISDGVGTFGITSLGSGILSLKGANTYDGDTLVSEGTVVLSNSTSAGSGAGTVKVAAGASAIVSGNGLSITNPFQVAGTLGNVLGANTLTGPITLLADVPVNVGAGSSLTLGGVVTDGAAKFSLSSTGTGTLILAKANTFDGGLKVNAGMVVLRNSTAAGTGAITVSNGAGLRLDGNGLSVGNAISVVGTGSLGTGGLSNITGANSLTGQVTFGGDTQLNIDGTLTIQQGIVETAVSKLSLAGTGRLILSGANLYTGGTQVASGATLQVGDGKTGSILGDLLDNGAVDFNLGSSVSFLGVISGTGTLLFRGGGKFTLPSENTITGVTTIAAGTSLTVGNGFGGGKLVGDIVDNGALIFDRPSTTTIAQKISGTGSVTYKGAVNYTVTGVNSYTGGTQIPSGTGVVLTNGNSAGDTGAIQVADGAVLFLNPTVAPMKVANPIQVAGGGFDGITGAIQNLNGNNTLSGAITLTGLATRVNPGGSQVLITGAIGQSLSGASLTIAGNTGKLWMTADNTYTGTTVISAGTTLQLGAGGATGAIQSAAIFDNGTLIYDRTGTPTTTAAQISGNGQVIVASGDVNFTGNSTYTGDTLVQSGASLVVGDGGSGGAIESPVITVESGALFGLSRGGAYTFGSTLVGGGDFELLVSGPYLVNQDSTGFTGRVLVDAGATLDLQADYSGATADVTGTLAGTGKLGIVTTQPGSTIEPGPGSGAHLDIAGLNPTAGQGAMRFMVYSEQNPVTNTFVRAATSSSQFDISNLELIVDSQPSFTGTGLVQKLIENGTGGSIVGTFVDSFGNPIPDGATVPIGTTGKTAVIDYSFGPDNNDVALLFVENLVYSLYTYDSVAGTLDIQVGENTNVTIEGDSATGFSLTLTDNLTGRNIGWVQEGGDPDEPGSSTTTAMFKIPNLTAFNITQRSVVTIGSNAVNFAGSNIHFSTPASDSGLKIDLPLASGAVNFKGVTGNTINGRFLENIHKGDTALFDSGALTVTHAFDIAVSGAVDLGSTSSVYGGPVTIQAASANLGASSGLTLGTSQVTGDLVLGTAGGVSQAAGSTLKAANLEVQAKGAVTLSNTGNDFDSLKVSGSGNLAVKDADSLNVTGLSNLTGTVTVTTSGALTLPGGKVQSTGSQSYTAGSGAIDISGAGTNQFIANNQDISFQGSKITTPGNLVVQSKTSTLFVSSVSALSQEYTGDVTSSNLVVNSLGGPVTFQGKLTTSSFGTTGAVEYGLSLNGGGSFDTPVNFTAGDLLALGDSSTDVFLFKGGFTATSQQAGAATLLAGTFQTNHGAVQLQNLVLTADSVIDTYFGNVLGSTISLFGTQNLGGHMLNLRGTNEALGGDSTYTPGIVSADKGNLTVGGGPSLTTSTFELGGNIAGTSYPQLRASQVTLSQAALGVEFAPGYLPPLASSFKIVDNTGSQKINGIFDGLPEGSTITVGTETLSITYVGGDGNDIVLTNIKQLPPPVGPKVAEPFSLRAGSVVSGIGSGTVYIQSSDGAVQLIQPFPGYTGSLNMTTVDRTGDGIADSIAVIVAGGAAPHVVVIDAATGKVADSFYAFAPQFLGGGTLASGVVNLGGSLEPVILIGAGPGAEPSVSVFNAYDFTFEKAFYAYSQQYTGGVVVGVTSPDPTGASLVITGSAINSHVVLFDVNNPGLALASWYAFAPSTALQQMTVAGGDLNGDGYSEVLVGAATGWPASIAVFNTRSLVNPNDPNRYAAVKAFYAFPPGSPNFNTGVRVGVADVNKDGRLDVLAGSGPGVPGVLNAINYDTLDYLFSLQFGTTQGVTVASNLTTTP